MGLSSTAYVGSNITPTVCVNTFDGCDNRVNCTCVPQPSDELDVCEPPPKRTKPDDTRIMLAVSNPSDVSNVDDNPSSSSDFTGTERRGLGRPSSLSPIVRLGYLQPNTLLGQRVPHLIGRPPDECFEDPLNQ